MGFSLIPTMDKMNVLLTLQRAYPTLEQLGFFPAYSGSISMRVGKYKPSSFFFGINQDIDNHPSPSFPYAPEFIFVDQDALPCEASPLSPSKEFHLHAKIYRYTGCAVILHVHTTMNYWISHYYHEQSYVSFDCNELLISSGLCPYDSQLKVKIFPNLYQSPTSSSISQMISTTIHPDIPILLGHKHGVYVWGNTIAEAVRRLQAFEFTCKLEYTLLTQK